MKQIKLIFIFCVLLVTLSGCQSAKRALTGQSMENKADEFLVKKKNPLILPPDFEKLPVPKNEQTSEDVDQQDLNLKKLIDKDTGDTADTVSDKSESKNVQNLEKSILKKINKN